MAQLRKHGETYTINNVSRYVVGKPWVIKVWFHDTLET